MSTKASEQDIEIKIIKVLQSAFDCFYGKSNVKVSFEEKEQGAGTVKPGVLKIIDEALKIEKKLELKFEYEYPRFFTTFLLESFEEELSENNMGNLKEVEIEDFGKSIYYGACNLFERYMRDFFHLHMEDITGISSFYYEGAVAEGTMCFFIAPGDELLIELADNKYSMKIPFCGANIKKIRKMLEITKSEGRQNLFALAFSFDGEWKLDGFADCISNNVHWIRIDFIKHMVWDMYWGSERIIRYSCGRYIDPETTYEDIFEKKLSSLCDGDGSKLWGLVNAAIGQKHGTTLVIICEENKIVRKEIERLLKGSIGTMLSTRKDVNVLKPEYVSGLTTVDGALILDHKGRAYGYGMIFASKGIKRIKRDSGRGARFNSAKFYIADLAQRGKKAIAVIVSEDGMVNFYSTEDANEEGAGNAD